MIKIAIILIALLSLLCLLLLWIIYCQRKRLMHLQQVSLFQQKRADDLWTNLEEVLKKRPSIQKEPSGHKAA